MDSSSATTTDDHDDIAWAKGLKKSGLYFDGFVDDIESVLEKHRRDTVTFYGTRTSTGGVAEKENVAPSTDHGQAMPSKNTLRPLHWHHKAAGTVISFGNTPFQIGYKQDLDCQYGDHYTKKESSQTEKKKFPRVRTQGTRKQGCKVHIQVREYILYPNYSLEEEVASKLSKWKLRLVREEKLKALKHDLERGVANNVRKYYVSLPTAEAHHTTHPTGGIYGMAQKVHPKVIEKIHQLVSEGVTSVPEMKWALEHYVKYDLCQDCPPDVNGRAYHPSSNDINNHIHRAKSQLQ